MNDITVKFKMYDGYLLRMYEGKGQPQFCPYQRTTGGRIQCGVHCPMFEMNDVGYVFLKCNRVLCDIREEE